MAAGRIEDADLAAAIDRGRSLGTEAAAEMAAGK
jgi:hypothetical protein